MGRFNDLPADVMWIIFKLYLSGKKYDVRQCIMFGGETSKQTETFGLISRRSMDLIRKRTMIVRPLSWLELFYFKVQHGYLRDNSLGWKFKFPINGVL